ncbi:unnamed protein product, partial [Prorocentrum cordatum]
STIWRKKHARNRKNTGNGRPSDAQGGAAVAPRAGARRGQALALNELAEREFSASLQLEDLRGALREVGAGAAWDGAGSQLGAAPWWLRQRSLRDAATRVLEEVLPCADPCVTGMVSSGREALECIGLDEPAAVWPAVLGLLAHSAALHALAWLCLSKLSRERR